MTLAEDEMERHRKHAKLSKRPTSKYYTCRSFEDCVGGMRQIGDDVYDVYDDFTPHVLNLAGVFFLWPVVEEGCQRYGRTWVKASLVGVHSPTPRTPQEWKWGQGPNRMLQTPSAINKTVVQKGFALQLRDPGEYVIEVSRGRKNAKYMELLLTVQTGLDDRSFRQYMNSLPGKIDVMQKVQAVDGAKGSVIVVPDSVSLTLPIPIAL